MDIEEESMNSSPPSSIPGTTSGVKKMGFKTPRRIIPQYMGK